MRRFLLAAVILGTATATQAADMPDFLRGSFTAPVARTNWQGVYIGGFGAALDVLQGNPLPHALDVRPKADATDPARMESLRRYLAANLAVFSFMTPLFGVTFGVVLLGEELSLNFVIGAVLVLAGITFVSAEQWLRRRLRKALGQH